MKKFIFLILFCIIPAFAYAEDVKIYDRNYRYSGKVDLDTGYIYNNQWRRVGKVDMQTGYVYDKNYRVVSPYYGKYKTSGGCRSRH